MWAGALLDEAAVRDLAETWFRALTALTQHAAQAGAGGWTPSDLALVDLTQGEIERLEAEYPKIEDILPLSPLQEGLLFHALYDAQGPDVYTVQLELELEGLLDAAVLEASLQAVVARHASLRAGFRHEQLSRPVQVVVARAAVPWRLIDLSGQDAAGQQRELSAIVEADRLERFDLVGAAVDAVCADPACGGPASAADQQPSPVDGRLVGADPGAGAARGLCAARQRGVAAAGDAVPRLSRASSPGRTVRRDWRHGARRWPGSRRARGWRRGRRAASRWRRSRSCCRSMRR